MVHVPCKTWAHLAAQGGRYGGVAIIGWASQLLALFDEFLQANATELQHAEAALLTEMPALVAPPPPMQELWVQCGRCSKWRNISR